MTEIDQGPASQPEALWGGPFGDAYLDRNRDAGARRGPFWERLLGQLPVASALEIGCNLGANLRWVAGRPIQACGVDVNARALATLRREVPAAAAVRAAAAELPFRDGAFDLVFTVGVLIHQPEESLPTVIGEMARCARRYLLCGEYFAETTTEVPYRGQPGALFRRDYGRIVQELHPRLRLRQRGFLGPDQGFDDVTYWVFELP